MVVISKELFKKIHRIQIQTSKLVEDVLAGAYRSAFKGNGLECEEVREYQAGDDVRSIDWNVTARMHYPFVKKFREERELTVMLLVDVSASSHFGTEDRLKSEWIAEIGAVIAFSAIKNNDKVGIILFTNKVEKYIPPKRGLRHVLRIIRELLAFETIEKGTDMNAALSFLGNVQRRSVVCFIISDFMTALTPHALKVLARRHDLIGISIRDPKEMHFPKMGLVQLQDLESGEMLLVDTDSKEVRETFEHNGLKQWKEWSYLMSSLGSKLLELHTDKPYQVAIRKYFQQRKART